MKVEGNHKNTQTDGLYIIRSLIHSTSSPKCGPDTVLHSWHYFLYGMFVFPQNSYVEILPPMLMVLGGEALGRWLGHENGALKNGSNALRRETPESFHPFTYKKIPQGDWPSTNQEEGSHQKTKSASNLTLNFPASIAGRNKFLVFISHPVYGSPNGLMHVVWHSVLSSQSLRSSKKYRPKAANQRQLWGKIRVCSRGAVSRWVVRE